MQISSTLNTQFELIKEEEIEETFYISKELYDKAKSLNSPNKTAVIFDDDVIAIKNDNLEDLKKIFKSGFSKYEDILLSKNKATEYLKKISDYVLNDLNVINADRDSNGMLTVSESLDVRLLVDKEHNAILKARDIYTPSQLSSLDQDNSNFISINDMLNIHISLDKNKNGIVTVKEISPDNKDEEASPIHREIKQLEVLKKMLGGVSSDGSSDKLTELMEKQKEIQKKINQIMKKLSNAKEDQVMILEEQLNTLNTQLSTITAQILALMKESIGK